MRQKLRTSCTALVLLFLIGLSGLAQTPAKKASALGTAALGTAALGTAAPGTAAPNMKKEIDDLKKGQESIRKELQEIKGMLLAMGAPPPEKDIRGIEFEIANYPVKGSATAKLVMVDFTDYQCQYCGRYARDTFPKIVQQYVDTGKMRYAIIDLPLPGHPKAPKATEASHCAGDQDKFWEMHDQLMAKQESLDDLSSYATSLNLDMNRFGECLKTNKYAGYAQKATAIAQKLDVRAVPGFVLAVSDPKNPLKLKAVASIRGAAPLENFQSEIEKALANLPK